MPEDCSGCLLSTLRYTIKCCNYFFRTLRKYGLWIPSPACLEAAVAGQDMVAPCQCLVLRAFTFPCACPHPVLPNSLAKEGYGYLATMCHRRNWRLFYLRPKIHLTQHSVISMGALPTRALNPLSTGV